MLPLTKLTIVIASLAFTCASTRPVAAQNQDMAMGNFVIYPIPINLVTRIRTTEVWIVGYGERLGPPCCGRMGCVICHPRPLHEIRKFMKGEELGILVESRILDSVAPEEIRIEIYSPDKTLLFWIDLKYDERDRKVDLKSKGRRVAYLVTPDKDAARALAKHFLKGKWINVVFKVKEPMKASDKVYLVNRTSLGR